MPALNSCVNRGLADDSVKDDGQTRGEEQTETAAGGQQAEGKAFLVTIAEQGG